MHEVPGRVFICCSFLFSLFFPYQFSLVFPYFVFISTILTSHFNNYKFSFSPSMDNYHVGAVTVLLLLSCDMHLKRKMALSFLDNHHVLCTTISFITVSLRPYYHAN